MWWFYCQPGNAPAETAEVKYNLYASGHSSAVSDSTGSYPISILLNAGCALIRLVRRFGKRPATGLEEFLFALRTFTVFMEGQITVN